MIRIIYLVLIGILFGSCKKECDDGIEFFGECIDSSSKSIFQSEEYKTDLCNVSFLFEITYGDKIDVKKYQYSHSHDPRVHWTLATGVSIGQSLNGGVSCEEKLTPGPDMTQYYFTVPSKDDISFPLTIKRIDRLTFTTLDSTVLVFDKLE